MAFNYKKKWTRALRLMDTPIEKKPVKTWEWDLFIEIAKERQVNWYVEAKHLDEEWNECTKWIKLEDLQPINFAHIKPKGTYPELRLVKENIQIVSFRYHFYEHNQLLDKLHRRN